MIIKGKVKRIYKPDGSDNDINTDYIISGRYKFKIEDPKELGKHIFEDLNPNFVEKISPGDILVAGKNFGCGSSREQAPLAIKSAGIMAIIAQSFARIFYRNAFNLALPLIECETKNIQEDDFLEIDLEKGIVKNLTKRGNHLNKEIKIKPLPKMMLELLKTGGLVEYFKKYKGFNF
ncbi:MAG TPA: 3-isopropylmalate dehydratase [Elusimicrobia bacterium]|jgi:3-isopropylmalate/(R)-2-methylmalate dehydratase small subunit|nr:3-isopropylmalate dehydratase [Elusimicrobiota bacterium]